MPSPIALFRRFPELEAAVPWTVLGQWPTPVEPLTGVQRALGCGPVDVKREDRSSTAFGGNKVRTLEGLFGVAIDHGADRIWTTGAYGSNHACAMALHAEQAGIECGAVVFPQPPGDSSCANFLALASTRCRIVRLWNVTALPFAMLSLWRDYRRGGERPYLMTPGGAIPAGALGHVSGAIEFAEQIEAGECPAPRQVVLACGSTCTTAGLMVGFQLAARLGIGFGAGKAPVPDIVAVRVTPWPITTATNITMLARATSRMLVRTIGVTGDFDYRTLRRMVRVDTRFFGAGYGRPTTAGAEARKLFAEGGGPPLDQVYSEKSGAAVIAMLRENQPGPIVYWATRTSVPLPEPNPAQRAAIDPGIQRWLRKRRPPAR
jgi:1-aminocyclopropane-1-carboxylate deaminase/D-cysteine desulfhydrase-like pyridoxal-dependent ACC family enzyme